MNIYNLTFDELENYFLSINEKKYRASQVFEWLYEKKVRKFNEMTNIKKELQDVLANDFSNYFN